MPATERTRKIVELFEQVVDLDEEMRDQILKQAGIKDPKLRAEIELLLTSNQKAAKQDFLRPFFAPALLPSLVGQTVGPFLIVDIIDSGGMGTVYKAHHAILDRDVAFKTPNISVADQADISRMFKSEGKTLASLDHPHIVKIYDAGATNEGLPYLAMVFINGENLSSYIQGPDQLDIDTIVTWIKQIIDALVYLDEQGITHRDIKPQNILINNKGHAILTDFGLARRMIQSLPEQRIFATPAYLCPEYGTGESNNRCDIYSLGVVLFECLTQEYPGQQTLKTLRPETPSWLVKISIKCLQKDPDERYQHAIELRDALNRGTSQGSRRWATSISTAVMLLLFIFYWSTPKTTTHPVIQTLMDAGVVSVDSLYTTLINIRETGAVVFGSREDFPYDPTPCYIFVFQQDFKTFEAVLSPGSLRRTDLLNGREIQDTDTFLDTKNSIWVYLIAE